MLTSVLGEPRLAVVGPRPDPPALEGRLRERDDGAVGLGVGAPGHHLRRVLGREIGARELPAVAAIVELEQVVPAQPDHGRVVRRDRERRVPVEPEHRFALLGRGLEVPFLAGVETEAVERTALGFVVDGVRVGGVDGDVESIAAPQAVPLIVDDPVVLGVVEPGLGLEAGLARPAPGLVVLEPAADEVGVAEVHGQVVELADREVVEEVPGLGAVVAQEDPAVGAEPHVLGAGGLDPHGVQVGVQVLGAARGERPAAVVRYPEVGAQQVDPLLVVGLDPDLAEVEGPRRVGAEAGPVVSPVVAAEHASGAALRLERVDVTTLVRLDHGEDHLGVAAVDVEPDTAGLGGQASRELGPRASPVAGAEDPAGGSPGAVRPRRAEPRVHRGVEDLRVARIHDQVLCPGPGVHL